MGVVGLWQLLDSTGRPVRLETLEGKVLAIDISIWLNQLVKGYRGAGGASVDNAHLIGLFQRVCKLLHYKIKPVFVFDGEAPALKYQTLATRKRRRDDGDDAIRKATHRMLQNYVEQKLLGEANPKVPKIRPTRREREEQDMFKLPECRALGSDDDDSISDTDVTFNADLASIKVDSEEFKSLPSEMQHEFLVALKEREKKGSRPVDELPVDGDDFSGYQMSQILKRHKLQAKIQDVQKEMNDGLLRVASDANVQVILKISPLKMSSLPEKKENEDESEEGSPAKKIKLEPIVLEDECATLVPDKKEKRVENFLISQWLEGAQKGEEANETLRKAVQLVKDEEPAVMSDSSSEDERPTGRRRLISSGGKVSAEEAMRLLEAPGLPVSEATTHTSKDSLVSDGVSLDVGPGSILSSSTTRVIQPDEAFDEGSHSKKTSDDEIDQNIQFGTAEDSADQTCNTDVLNADLEVSETGNSVFDKMDDTVEQSKSQHDESSALSSQSCKLTEVQGSPVIKEVSFIGEGHNCLNTNDDIVMLHNLSRYASKEPSRCNSNSQGFIPSIAPVTLPDNPTDFHQALEIIKEQERRQSECLEDDEAAKLTATAVNGDCRPDSGHSEDEDLIDETIGGKSEPNNNVLLSRGDETTTNGTVSSGLPAEMVEAKKQDLEIRSQALQNEINRIQRQTSEITSSMTEDCEELLKLFGIPCVRAPREAEAQCAALENAGLVHGVVTDDSDIFLFGGQTIYRNLFSQDHQCEMFTAKTIETNLKLSREDMIGFAMLTGSDYTNGIENVGPVMACEILSEFRKGKSVLKALNDFKDWWSLSRKGATPPKNSVRMRFIRLSLDAKFPSEAVYNAYLEPSVETVTNKFNWARPDLDMLRGFSLKKFNWTKEKVDSYLLPILKKYEDKTSQLRIDSMLLPTLQKRENLFPSKRIKAAVGKLRPTPQDEANLSESSSDSE